MMMMMMTRPFHMKFALKVTQSLTRLLFTAEQDRQDQSVLES